MSSDQIEVYCPHCTEQFTAPTSMKGGLANCPACGRAVPVGGGPEPLFWALFSLGVAAVLLISGVSFAAAGPVGGILTLLIGAAILTIIVVAS